MALERAHGRHGGVDGVRVDARRTLACTVLLGLATLVAACGGSADPAAPSFAVLPQTGMLSLRAALSGSEGLELVSPADGVALERLQAGSIHRFTVTAVSARPGTRVVNVAMTLELPTGPATRTFGVPVVIGAPAGA